MGSAEAATSGSNRIGQLLNVAFDGMMMMYVLTVTEQKGSILKPTYQGKALAMMHRTIVDDTGLYTTIQENELGVVPLVYWLVVWPMAAKKE